MDNITQDNGIAAQIQFRAIELMSSGLYAGQNIKDVINDFVFEIETEVQINSINKFIIVIVKVVIFSGNKELELGNIGASHIFQINNFDEVIINDNSGLRIPDFLLVTLNSLALSTTRGIMWDTFKGTILHNAILPILDPNQVLEQVPKFQNQNEAK